MVQREILRASTVMSGITCLLGASSTTLKDDGANSTAIVNKQDVTVGAPASTVATSSGFVTATGQISAGGLEGEWLEVGDLAVGRFAITPTLGCTKLPISTTATSAGASILRAATTD
jgi:hypothetical protein